MLETLQQHGMLKRDNNPDLSLMRELLTSIAHTLECEHCYKLGVSVEDDWTDDWDEEVRCQGCQAAIDRERLEVFPDTKFCPNCQSKAESGSAPGDALEYCVSCGGVMQIMRRGGVGLAGYTMVCTDCGKRG
jgi:hypothetical protein